MYFVLEIQKRTDGTWHTTTFNYEDRMQAEAKYFYILSEAAVAKIPRNGAVVIDGNGSVLMSYVYQHGEYEGYVEPTEE